MTIWKWGKICKKGSDGTFQGDWGGDIWEKVDFFFGVWSERNNGKKQKKKRARFLEQVKKEGLIKRKV